MEDITTSLERFENKLLRKADMKTLDAYERLVKDINKREAYISELEITLLHLHYRYNKGRQTFQTLAKGERLIADCKKLISWIQ